MFIKINQILIFMKHNYNFICALISFIFLGSLHAQDLDWYNTQWVSDGTNGSNSSLSVDEGTSISIYSQAYEPGVTDAVGQGAGVECWVGINAADTDPSTWDESVWQVSTYSQDSGNNDEYSYSTSSTAAGTHFVATRWRLSSGAFTYGGYNGPWDGLNNVNIELNVNAVAQPLLITTSVCTTATSVRLTGPWWGWNPSGGPIAADNGDGTWTFTFDPAPSENMEYLLVVDGVQENLISIMANGGSCAPVTDYFSYANRRWDLGSGNVTNNYGQCGSTCVAPVITLTGTNVTINVGDTYSDAGATASDDEEGDVTANIVVGGDTVDTATAGTYTITYDVSDGAGNAATQVSRTVTVEMPPCGNAIALTPGTQQCGNTSTFGDAFDDSTCLGNYDGGDDALYVYTATEDGETLDLTLTGQASWTGFAMSKGCPTGGTEVCVGSQTSSGSGTLNFVSDPLEAGEVYYIHISTYPTPQSTAYCLDATLIAAPSCFTPTSFATSDVSATSATFGWTAGASESTWNIEYGADGFTQGAGTTVAVTTNPYTLSGLTANTAYDVYIQADCGAGDTSEWVGPLSFTTPCQAFVPDYTEDFDPFLDGCWSEATGPISGPNAGSTTSDWLQDDFGNNTLNGKSARFNIYATGGDEWLISPTFDLSNGGYEINLDVALTQYGSTSSGTIGSDDAVYLMQSLDNGTTWTTIYTWDASNSPSNTGDNVTIDITSLTSASAKFAVFALEGSTSGGDLDFFVDNFSVRTPPSCYSPSSLSAANITAMAADLSWTAGDSETTWNIEYGAEGFTQGAGTTVAVTTNPYTLSGLTANTAYDYYIQADCGANGASAWVGPYTFSTACESYTIPYFEGFETGYTHAISVGGCLVQESVTGSGTWTANNTTTTYNRTPRTGGWNAYLAYSNEDWLFIRVDLVGDTSYTAEVYARQDGSGSTNSNITISYGTDATASAMTNTIVPATGIINGDYQLISGAFTPTTSGTYVVGIKGYMNGSPWYISIDDISINLTPSCIAPSAMTSSNITDTSADISWTAGGSETDYEYVVQAAGTGEPTAAGTAVTGATSVSLGSLTSNTDYEVYLRSACTGGEFSTWAGPFSFTTEPAPIVPNYTNDFSTYPGEFWSEAAGSLASGPTGTSSSWSEDGFGNNGTTGAARVNIYSTLADEWLISPMFDLSGGTYYLNLDAAATEYGSSTLDAIWGSDDFATLMASTDGGSTWTELYRWDANNSPGLAGAAMPQITLTGYSATSKFALYGESSVSNEDIDFFVDNFQITTTSLGIEDNNVLQFKYFPNPVHDLLTIKAQNTVEDIKVFNMLGQLVLRQSPNTRDCTINLSAMQSGAYFVQVSVGNTVETVRILKN